MRPGSAITPLNPSKWVWSGGRRGKLHSSPLSWKGPCDGVFELQRSFKEFCTSTLSLNIIQIIRPTTANIWCYNQLFWGVCWSRSGMLHFYVVWDVIILFKWKQISSSGASASFGLLKFSVVGMCTWKNKNENKTSKAKFGGREVWQHLFAFPLFWLNARMAPVWKGVWLWCI